MRLPLLVLPLVLLLVCPVGSARSQDKPAVELAEVGIPAVSRTWRGDDYAQVQGLIQSGKLRFAKLTPGQRSLLIERMSNPENLEFPGYKEVSIRLKLPALAKMMESLQPILLQLEDDAKKDPSLYSATASMLTFTVRFGAAPVDVGNAALATVPKEHQAAARKEALSVMHNGIMQSIDGAQIALAERQFSGRRNAARCLTPLLIQCQS